MEPAPQGFVFAAGDERRTATARVFDVERAPGGGERLVCKRLGSRARDEPWVVARLASEGELLRTLGGVVTPKLVAAGVDAYGPFLVMGRAPGHPLAERIGRASGPWVTAAARATFAALGHLHGASVVHADLSADNVLVPDDGRAATLLDFGLALYPGAPPMPVGPFRGTPVYAAPEAARGEVISEAADLFGLATVLLHVASGRAPRAADSPAAMLIRAAEEDLTPWAREAARGLPAELGAALVACCAFDARVRPKSAEAALARMTAL